MATCKQFLASSALLATIASFNCAASDLYKVSASLTDKNQTIGSPTLVVKNATPASIEVSGPTGYKLSLTVTDLAPDKIQVATSIESQQRTIAPTIVVRPGKPAAISVGDLGITLTVDRAGS